MMGRVALYAAACRTVEHDLSDSDALTAIREYERQRPFPRKYSDSDILNRIRDAECSPDVQRGTKLITTNGHGAPAWLSSEYDDDPTDTIDSINSPVGQTDSANAARFHRLHGASVRFCDQWSQWFNWSGKHWARDFTREIDARAAGVHRLMWKIIIHASEENVARVSKEAIKWARYTANARGRYEFLKLARSLPSIPMTPKDMDSNPWAFNCTNGTLDLRIGQFHTHHRDDCITKLCPVAYNPDADCPIWQSLLHRIMANNAELVEFLQRAVGYSLTGTAREHILLFLHGDSGERQINLPQCALLGVFGEDYAMQAPPRFDHGKA